MKNIPFEIDSEKTEAFLASVDHNAYNRAMERARKMSGSASVDSRPVKTQLYHDNFQNYKRYNIPKAQLVIADIPYNIGANFYGSNPTWYIGGDRKNGESKHAGKAAFRSDFNFNIAEYFHFCNKLLKREPKSEQWEREILRRALYDRCSAPSNRSRASKHTRRNTAFKNSIPLVFCKNYSPQVLKANMRICGATEYALVLYRGKLPKFRNQGKMIFNWFEWKRDSAERIPKNPSGSKTGGGIETVDRDFYRSGGCGNRSLCGKRKHIKGLYGAGAEQLRI